MRLLPPPPAHARAAGPGRPAAPRSAARAVRPRLPGRPSQAPLVACRRLRPGRGPLRPAGPSFCGAVQCVGREAGLEPRAGRTRPPEARVTRGRGLAGPDGDAWLGREAEPQPCGPQLSKATDRLCPFSGARRPPESYTPNRRSPRVSSPVINELCLVGVLYRRCCRFQFYTEGT